MRDIKDYIAPMSKQIILNDKAQMNHFAKIDQMVELDYSLPTEMSELKWMRTIKDIGPLSTITTGRRTLATIEPLVFIQPLNNNLITKKLANQNEQNLLYQLKQANKRSEHDIVGDLIESALRYDMVCALTIPLKWQMKGNTAYQSRFASKNLNGFMVQVENPQDVYPRFSPFGLESVLHVKVMRAADAVSFYGDKAKKLFNKIKDEELELYVTVFDWWGEQRATWISEAIEHATVAEPTSVEYIIHDEENEMDFLPWTIKKGGTSLGSKSDHKVRPLLGPIAHADLWDTNNIAKSLAFSEALGYAAAPRGVVVSYAEESVVVDYGDINKLVRLKPGEDYKPINPPAIDQNLLHVFDRTSADMDKLTGIKNLANLDPPSGTAFATVNAVIKAATAALDPPKKVAEAGFSGIFEDMLRWTSFTGDDMVGYVSDGADMGKEFRLGSKHIEVDDIDVDVKLTAHVPTDRLQRINAASLLIKEMDFSKEDAYGEIDVADPQDIMARRQQEILDEVVFANKVKEMNAQTELAIQAQQMQMQMQAQQAQQQQQQAQQQQMQQAQQQQAQQQLQGAPEQNRTGEPRREAQSQAVRGRQGFNPARGGQSPNEVDPEGFLREKLSGRDKEGGAI